MEHRVTNGELFVWGCFSGETIIGVIAARPPCHISLLFVDKEYHRQEIAKALYETVLNYYKNSSDYTTVTVNSSPYALDSISKIGFSGYRCRTDCKWPAFYSYETHLSLGFAIINVKRRKIL